MRNGTGASDRGNAILSDLPLDRVRAFELPFVLQRRVPLLATSSHADALLHEADLPQPCAWVMGHEGQGVAEPLMKRCALRVG